MSKITRYIVRRHNWIINNRLTLIWANIVYPERMSTYAFNAIRKYKIDLFIDVGANNGLSGIDMRYYFRGKMLSYEPVSHAYKALANKAIKDTKWDAYQLALGAGDGKKTINVTGGTAATSSFLNLKDYYVEHFRMEKCPATQTAAKTVGTENVAVKTLDFCIENHAGGGEQFSCIFLKLDVQGYEINVMKGLNKYLDKVFLVKLEMSFLGREYDNQPNIYEVISYMRQSGFILTKLVTAASPKTGELYECDGFFINTNHKRFQQND